MRCLTMMHCRRSLPRQWRTCKRSLFLRARCSTSRFRASLIRSSARPSRQIRAAKWHPHTRSKSRCKQGKWSNCATWTKSANRGNRHFREGCRTSLRRSSSLWTSWSTWEDNRVWIATHRSINSVMVHTKLVASRRTSRRYPLSSWCWLTVVITTNATIKCCREIRR